jgi:beta-lactamase regulating signal transducer with metallopeptidase domain
MNIATLLWIVGGIAAAAIVGLFIALRQPRDSSDLGSVSTAWTTEHNATTHGRHSS